MSRFPKLLIGFSLLAVGRLISSYLFNVACELLVPYSQMKSFKFIRTQDLVFYVYLTTLIISSAFIIYSLRGLRPIADDYCHAAVGGEGLLNYFNAYYFNWNSDILALVINYFILGFPLASLPYSVASALTLICSIICVNLLILGLVFDKLKISTFIKIFPVTILSYLGFWMTSKIFSQNSNFIDLSNMIIHWQTVNGFYIVLSSLSFLTILFMTSAKKLRKNYFKLFFFMGLIVGTSGILLTFIILLFNFLYMLFLFVTKSMMLWKRFSVFTLGLSFGILITFISPGTKARSEALRGLWASPNLDIGVLFSWTFPLALFEWLQGVMHPGAIVAVAFGFTLGAFSKNFGWAKSMNKLTHNFLIVFTFSVIASILSQLSEAFSYVAFHHLVIPYLLIFLLCLILGMMLGIIVSAVSDSLIPSIMVMTLILSTVALNTRLLDKDISERKIAWQNGPAPFSNIGDIEAKEGWIYACWKDMKNLKGYPER